MSRSDGVQAEVNVPVSIIFEKLSYDKVSGILSWKGTSKNSGKAAGYYRTNLSGITYLIVGIGYEGKVYKIFGHRLAWLIVTGVWPDGWTETTWSYNIGNVVDIYKRNGGLLV